MNSVGSGERATTPDALVRQLIDLLDVEAIDADRFRGRRQPGGVGRVFGGQVIAQALQAAQLTVDAPKIAHSLHAYFMRGGDEDHPIEYRVKRDFDGRSFANRRIVAIQNDLAILNMTASFQTPEDGLHHQIEMPEAPPPETLRPDRELREAIENRVPETLRQWFLRPRPVEIRPCSPRNWFYPEATEPRQASWMRAVTPLPDDPALHRAMLVYASDMSLLGTSMIPHRLSWMNAKIQTASLDHSVWLHEDFRFDDWLLYVCDSPWTGHSRGFNRGEIFTRDGRLVASTSQEGLIRERI